MCQPLCPALSLPSRLGVRQLQLVRGPQRILLTAQELAFIHPPLSSQVGGPGVGWGRKQGTEAPPKLLTVPAPSRGCIRIGKVRVNQEVRQMVGA